MKKTFYPLSIQTYVKHYGGVLPHYSAYQNGTGLGSVLRRLFSPIIPIIKQHAKVIGRKALKRGLDLGQDVLEGQNFKEAGKKRIKQLAQDIFDQSGSGKRRTRRINGLLCASGFKRRPRRRA